AGGQFHARRKALVRVQADPARGPHDELVVRRRGDPVVGVQARVVADHDGALAVCRAGIRAEGDGEVAAGDVVRPDGDAEGGGGAARADGDGSQPVRLRVLAQGDG